MDNTLVLRSIHFRFTQQPCRGREGGRLSNKQRLSYKTMNGTMNGRALTDQDQGTEGGCATWALQTAPHNHSVITIGTEHAVQLTASFSGRSVATRRSSWHEGLPARHGGGGGGGEVTQDVTYSYSSQWIRGNEAVE